MIGILAGPAPTNMPITMGKSYLTRCWASVGSCQCYETVAADPDSIGLCERHREELRNGRG